MRPSTQLPRLLIGPLLLALSSCLLAQESVVGDPTVVVPGSTVELLFNGAFITEGPAVAPDGSVYFSDITITDQTEMQAGHIWRYDPRTGTTSVFRSPSGMANGIVFDVAGRMVVAEGADFGGRRITRTDLDTGKSVILAGLYEGKALNSPNDLEVGDAGRIYFTDPRYSGHEPVDQPVEGVYRLDPDGTLVRIVADIDKPNGIVISPDQRRLYVAAVAGSDQAIFQYDLDSAGNVVGGSTLIDFTTGRGPDGLTVDSDGNIYAARIDETRGIYVYSPEGEQLAVIPTPEWPRNVTFGRDDTASTLYITAGT